MSLITVLAIVPQIAQRAAVTKLVDIQVHNQTVQLPVQKKITQEDVLMTRKLVVSAQAASCEQLHVTQVTNAKTITAVLVVVPLLSSLS